MAINIQSNSSNVNKLYSETSLVSKFLIKKLGYIFS